MITVFTGSPGAGKTAALVDLLSKLDDSRPLYVDGLNGFNLPHEAVDSLEWHSTIPDGSILVVDEVQRVWRPRPAGSKVPQSVQELETHRHRGIDVYLTTQSPSLLDANVRALVGRHIHIRDTGILGRWWYEWPEINTAMSWKTCVNKRKFSLPKSAFTLYKSASLHTKPVRGIPRALYAVVLALVAFFGLAYYAWSSLQKKVAPVVEPVISSPAGGKMTGSISNGSRDLPRSIDDRVDFIPRVSNKPESAPAYDHLRVIAVMPVVVGGWCQGIVCRCMTQQGTQSGLSDTECREWLANPPFNPYAPLARVPESREAAPSGIDVRAAGSAAAAVIAPAAASLLPQT